MEVRIENRKIYIDGKSREEMFQIYNKFRNDLMDCNIKHYRPIAVKLVSGGSFNNLIETISKLNCSYADLTFIVGNLICCTSKGKEPVGRPFSDLAGIVPESSNLANNAKFITLYGKDIGTSYRGSIFYNGCGDINRITDDVIPRTLLADCDLLTKLQSSVNISVIMKKGTGFLDFQDNDNNFKRVANGLTYVAARTRFDLSKFFSVCYFDASPRATSENCIELRYLVNLNEDVLNDILIEYFDDFEQEGNSNVTES